MARAVRKNTHRFGAFEVYACLAHGFLRDVWLGRLFFTSPQTAELAVKTSRGWLSAVGLPCAFLVSDRRTSWRSCHYREEALKNAIEALTQWSQEKVATSVVLAAIAKPEVMRPPPRRRPKQKLTP